MYRRSLRERKPLSGHVCSWGRGCVVTCEEYLGCRCASLYIVGYIDQSLFKIPASEIGVVDTSICYRLGEGRALG